MSEHPRIGGAATLVLFLVFLTHPANAGSRMSFASPRFSSNAVEVNCTPFGDCTDSQFELDSLGAAVCVTDDGTPPHCSGGASTEAAPGVWSITTQLFYWGPPYEAPGGCASTGMTVEATRQNPELMELGLVIDSGSCDPRVQLDTGPVEVAVFRYSGDPAAFEGVEVASVDELVTLGLIQAEDILFRDVQVYDVDDDIIVVPYSVDVADVPDDEIVVFAAEQGIFFTSTVATPASSAWGVAVLVVSLLMVATWSLRRRTRQRAR